MKNSKFIIAISLFFLSANLSQAEMLTFSKAYELALENAHKIKSTQFTSDVEKEMIEQEKSRLYPQVNLSAYYKKSQYTYNDSGRPDIDQGLMNYSLNVRQSIYNPEIYSKIDMQKSRGDYYETKLEIQKQELAGEVFSTYLNILKSQNKINLHEAYLVYNSSKLKEITKRYEMNLANKMDLLKMKVDYNSAKIGASKEKKLHSVYDLKLKHLIGDDSYELPTINSSNSISEMLDKMLASVSVAKEPLVVKQTKQGLSISKAEMSLANDGHLPKVNLTGSYSQFDTDDPTIDAPYDTIKYLMLTVDIPIYSGGYISSKVQTAKLRFKAQREELSRVQKDVIVQKEEYMALFEASIESVEMYKEALVSAELYVESVEQGYEYGLKSIIDLNDAKVKLYEVKYKYVENIYEMVNSYIGLSIVTQNFDNLDILDSLVQ